MIYIYNSMTQKKEAFKPIEPNKVKIYVCGPTVYDFCHMGNARSFTAFDVVVRYLRFRGYKVTFVRNITDIDDKIIKKSKDNNEEFFTIVDRYTTAMHEDLAQIKLLSPDHEPRATLFIPQIIKIIQQLIDRNIAYIASNGDVYFEVRKFHQYGCLSHRDIDQLESGARVEINDVKRDPLDFVLWKLAKPGEPFWQSPWGEGRPGWHIECSAMSSNLLGDNFDIHGGGKDLIFPHHENEIAQSEAASQIKFANIWMHAGYLQIDKEKMSKSLGNFFTVRDLLEKYQAEVIRYFLITSHYRSPLNYSLDALIQSRNALVRFYTALRDLPQADRIKDTEFEKKFLEAMDDDFNTPIAISVLFDLAHHIQKIRENDIQLAAQHGALLKWLGSSLEILQDDPNNFLQAGVKVDANKIESLINARNLARSNKDWAEADRIRNELLNMSVILEDSSQGTTWKVES